MCANSLRLEAAQLTVDGQDVGRVTEVHTEVKTMRVESMTPEPDPNWRGVDAAGHEHSWEPAPLEAIPAVGFVTNAVRRSEQHWCEDCLDTHYDSWWECSECGEVIKPGDRMPLPKNVVVSKTMTLTVSPNPGYVHDHRLLPAVVQQGGGVLLEGETFLVSRERGSGHDRAVFAFAPTDGGRT